MLFSLIVPIYKVEPYLERCILSILNQKKGIWEAILVDDGSPDGSGAIADAYAKQYDSITVIHKENGGLSDARNVGLSIAKGEYVMFVDSDDELLPNALERLEHELNNVHPQVAFINTLWVSEGGHSVLRSKQGLMPREILTGAEALKKEFTTGSFFAMAQGCVCERSFLLDKNLIFKKGIIHEDEQWSPRMMLAADKVTYLPVDVYKYMLREGSITSCGDKPKKGQDIADTCEELFDIYMQSKDLEFRKVAFRYNAKLYLKGLSILKRCGEKRKVRKKMILGRWAFPRILLQGGMFLLLPKFYAHVIDLKLIRGK